MREEKLGGNMERLMKFTAKFAAVLLLLALIPFILAYLIGLVFTTSEYWFWVKVCRFAVLGLIIVVPMLVQQWRENQRFFLKWVFFLLLYVVVTTYLWVKGF